MRRVAVVTDSTSYLPADLLARSEVAIIPLSVRLPDGESLRETEITDPAAFWERLADTQRLPTTSQPSLGDATAVLEPLLAAGRDVVCLHLSGGISGTVESVRIAANELATRYPERSIAVIDSRSACGGLGMSLTQTIAAAERGAPFSEVEAVTRDAIGRTRLWFALDTLEYLRRGGRIGTAAAWIGGQLKVKPILTVASTIEPIERVRTSRRAFDRLIEFAEQWRERGIDGWSVQHTRAPERADELVARCREIFATEPLLVSEIGPVIGVHAGPGLIGFGVLATETPLD